MICSECSFQDEKIGDVFVACFSKSVVLEIYADFINNFSEAMDLAKLESKRKSAFGDFLKVNISFTKSIYLSRLTYSFLDSGESPN